MNLNQLVTGIVELQGFTQSQAAKQVNKWLTLRNWLIGAYLVEYEQEGIDRATYGTALISTTAKRLKKAGVKGMGSSNLASFISFYQCYPQMLQTLSGNFPNTDSANTIFQTLSGTLPKLSSHKLNRPNVDEVDPNSLLDQCSWSHFIEFIRSA